MEDEEGGRREEGGKQKGGERREGTFSPWLPRISRTRWKRCSRLWLPGPTVVRQPLFLGTAGLTCGLAEMRSPHAKSLEWVAEPQGGLVRLLPPQQHHPQESGRCPVHDSASSLLAPVPRKFLMFCGFERDMGLGHWGSLL